MSQSHEDTKTWSVGIMVAFYVLLAAAGVGLAHWHGGGWGLWLPDRAASPCAGLGGAVCAGLSLFGGLLFGGAIVWLTRLGTKYWSALRAMRDAFGDVLSGLSRSDVFLVAISSAVAEELLFRGALLPILGIWWSTTVFALLHVPMGRGLAFWPLFAFIVGLGLASITLGTGTVLGAMVAHFVTNYWNLLDIVDQGLRDEST
ncbi:MAG: CPBP family intramembrane metalloprotease [Deltaproteobacteria bacterium]|nr:CPBP family intramembrane metalloprotease [Deltaproteobacteria bacterium]